MQRKLMLTITASAAAILFQPTVHTVWAQGQAALTGTISSEAEGKMEGVVVTAQKAGSIVRISVTTDEQGRYVFPENRLEPGEYKISIRAVGYDMDGATKATVETEKTATADIKLKKKPTEYLNQLYFDALVFTPEALRHLVAQVGASQVMLGSDHPIPWEQHPVDHVFATSTLSSKEKAAILGLNAARLLNIPTS